MQELFKRLWQSVQGSRVLILFLCIAIAIIIFPLQLHMSLGRLQHYGLGIFFIGLGYIMQCVWAYKTLGPCARLGHIATGLFIIVIAMTLYANPWLEPKMAVRTITHEDTRIHISIMYGLWLIPQILISALWIHEEINKLQIAHKKKP